MKARQLGTLDHLCSLVRESVQLGDFDQCLQEIRNAMAEYPDAPQPHNLLGIVLEKQGNHPSAMRHFRAAWALDPTYLPAEENLKTYATFYSRGRSAYDESDCEAAKADNYSVSYDAMGIGHVTRRV